MATDRRLIWIPIIHTEADLGSMADAVRRLHIQKIGRPRWEERCHAIEEFWSSLEKYIHGLDLPWDRSFLYQDGLPVCGHEREIVESLAEAGSRNHRILLDLINKGATLVGTESPELLGREYELAGQIVKTVNAGRPDLARRLESRSQMLLKERDLYIGNRIDQTLKSGEIGLLFLGMLHSLPTMPDDLEVIRRPAELRSVKGQVDINSRRRMAP